MDAQVAPRNQHTSFISALQSSVSGFQLLGKRWLLDDFLIPSRREGPKSKETFSKVLLRELFFILIALTCKRQVPLSPRNIVLTGLQFENSSQLFPFRAKEIQIFDLQTWVSLFGTIEVGTHTLEPTNRAIIWGGNKGIFYIG